LGAKIVFFYDITENDFYIEKNFDSIPYFNLKKINFDDFILHYMKKLILPVVIIGLAVMAFLAYNVYAIMLVPNTTFNEEKVDLYIATNSSYDDVKLMIKPLIKDFNTFETLATQKKYPQYIKFGKVVLKKNMTNNELVTALRNPVLINLTFNNQERIENLAGRVAKQIEADSTSLVHIMTDLGFLSDNGFESQQAIAMYLPNSYEFKWNTTAEQFRDRMLKEYRKFWTQDRINKAKAQGLTPIQATTLASIVHKETVKADERPKIAGVYLNRLKSGMLLQADPTVIFAKKLMDNNFSQEIKRVLNADLTIDSPYNTYKYSSLPPGPIFMPDINAIEAVINPENHDFIYFCASVTNFGYHEFARNHSEHEVNAAKYRAWISAQGVRR
jgi:UPF0755 protein